MSRKAYKSVEWWHAKYVVFLFSDLLAVRDVVVVVIVGFSTLTPLSSTPSLPHIHTRNSYTHPSSDASGGIFFNEILN